MSTNNQEWIGVDLDGTAELVWVHYDVTGKFIRRQILVSCCKDKDTGELVLTEQSLSIIEKTKQEILNDEYIAQAVASSPNPNHFPDE